MDIKKVVSQISFVVIFSFFYLLIFYYPILELGKLLNLYYNLKFQTIALILLLLPLIIRVLSEKIDNVFFRFTRSLIMFYLGVCFVLLTSITIFKILNYFMKTDLYLLGLIISISTIFFSIVGLLNANILKIKPITIHSKKIKKEVKVVQLTDIHIGSRSPKFLEKIVNKTNSIKADYTVITGDLVDFNTIMPQDLKALKNLKSKVYFVLGNHERYIDTNRVIKILENLNVKVLRDKAVIDKQIQFIGIDDADNKNQVETILKGIKIEKNKYSVLLYHRPQGYLYASKKEIDLMLCGHTHKGQIFPFNFLVKLQFKIVSGLKKFDNMYLYVSPGTGTWGPVLRLGSRNEITSFTLTNINL
jgi:predicted MPP superfamily phosphohydrolase